MLVSIVTLSGHYAISQLLIKILFDKLTFVYCV